MAAQLTSHLVKRLTSHHHHHHPTRLPSLALALPALAPFAPLGLRCASSSSSSSPSADPHPYLSQLGGRGSNPTTYGSGSTAGPHLGPFPLPHDSREAQMRAAKAKWAELGTGEKIGVVSVWTGSGVVVLVGGVLAVVVLWSTGSELWSEASPTRIFEDATERVKQSSELQSVLIEPFSFHGANSSNRLRRNRRISHQLSTDPQTGQDLMRIRFWVQAHDPIMDQEAWWPWIKRFVSVAIWQDSTRPEAFVTRDEKRAELEEMKNLQVEKENKPVGWGQWAVGGISSALKGLVPRTSTALNTAQNGTSGAALFKRARKPDLGEWSTAEVVAELKKDPTTGAFVYQSLTAFVPDTRHPNKYRIDVPTADLSEPTRGLNRLRFWHRTKTVAA
ncbi:BQ5605_C004g02977 [Microbotryum silenes-dioicae]|uniref:Mitochondrial import inner membrane translocase subunit Tim21 n=1 Tax=Microbotryum silenes-dioicae TaxID=796604 RepID=A0A2X0MDH3_9BASI|nr:BQ5605_C004g02977 [Microbotryum silenes-dioicae]